MELRVRKQRGDWLNRPLDKLGDHCWAENPTRETLLENGLILSLFLDCGVLGG
jgi:hypothetical protein